MQDRDLHTFQAGDFVVSGSASEVPGGALKASTHISGSIAGRRSIFADAAAGYYDAVTITGPVTPSFVRFVGSIHGTASGRSGQGWDFNGLVARLDFTSWRLNPDGTVAGGNGYPGIVHPGDGSVRTGSWDVPWSAFGFHNSAVFELALVAFGRIGTDVQGAPSVSFDSDFSNTAMLSAVQVFDAQNVDITSMMTISFASATVPEPATLALFGTGLGILGVISRRRREIT